MSVRSSAPVVGFNHNVKHGNRVYHVQTEDSGLPHGHFITHLFLGGNVVATLKSSYADRAGEPDLARLVRARMEEQHKTMLRRLVGGEFREMSGGLSAPHYQPGVLATGQTGPAAVNVAKAAPMSGEAVGRLAAAQPARAVASAPAPKPLIPQSPVARASAPPPAIPQAAAQPGEAKPAVRVPAQPVWQPAPPGKSNPSGRRMPGQPLPQTTRMPPVVRSPFSPPTIAPSGSGRQAQSGPARPNLFADSVKAVEAPHENLPTLFAEELISEKSLDEVILAFLSADLEQQK